MHLFARVSGAILLMGLMPMQSAQASDPYQPEPPILRASQTFDGAKHVVWTNVADQYPSETRTSGYTCSSAHVTCTITSWANNGASGSKAVATLSGDTSARNIILTVNRQLVHLSDSATAQVSSTFYINSDRVPRPNLIELNEKCCSYGTSYTYLDFKLSDTNSITSGPPMNIPVSYYLDPYLDNAANSASDIGEPLFSSGQPFITNVRLRTPVQGETFTASIGKVINIDVGVFASDVLTFGPFATLKAGLAPTVSGLKSEADGCSLTVDNYDPAFEFFFKSGDVTNVESRFHIHGHSPGESTDQYPSSTRIGYVLVNNISQLFRCTALPSKEQIEQAELAAQRENSRKAELQVAQNRDKLFSSINKSGPVNISDLTQAGFGKLSPSTLEYLNNKLASSGSGSLDQEQIEVQIKKAEAFESLISGMGALPSTKELVRIGFIPETIASKTNLVSKISKLPAESRNNPSSIEEFIKIQIQIESTRAAKLAARTGPKTR